MKRLQTRTVNSGYINLLLTATEPFAATIRQDRTAKSPFIDNRRNGPLPLRSVISIWEPDLIDITRTIWILSGNDNREK